MHPNDECAVDFFNNSYIHLNALMIGLIDNQLLLKYHTNLKYTVIFY